MSSVSFPGVILGGVPAANAILRILGSQNASHGNIFSHLCAAQMTVLLICPVNPPSLTLPNLFQEATEWTPL